MRQAIATMANDQDGSSLRNMTNVKKMTCKSEKLAVRTRLSKRALLVCTVGTIMISSTPAHAYVDPGSTGLILQAIIGTIAAGAVALKMYWQLLWAKWEKLRGKPSAPPTPNDAD